MRASILYVIKGPLGYLRMNLSPAMQGLGEDPWTSDKQAAIQFRHLSLAAVIASVHVGALVVPYADA